MRMLKGVGAFPLLLVFMILLLGLDTARAAARDLEPRQTLVHDGVTRSYVVRVPPGLDYRTKVPLVIVLHGGGGNAGKAEAMGGFTVKGARGGVIVA